MNKKFKIIAIHYVNVMGIASKEIKQKIEAYKADYAQFSKDKKVKEIFIPTNVEQRVEFTKI